MKQGETRSPYRNFLAEAEQNLETERSALGTRAARLGALRPLLPRGLRGELARLERAIQRPLQNAHDLELVRSCLDAYAERLDVAIAFSDHVARDRLMRWRQLRTWSSWALGTGAALLALVTLAVARDFSRPPPPPAPECRLTPQTLSPMSDTSSPMSDASNHCGLSVECARQGRCNTAPEGCYAASDEDCAASWDCKLDGRCHAQAGLCTFPDGGAKARPSDAASASGRLSATSPIAGNGAGLH